MLALKLGFVCVKFAYVNFKYIQEYIIMFVWKHHIYVYVSKHWMVRITHVEFHLSLNLKKKRVMKLKTLGLMGP